MTGEGGQKLVLVSACGVMGIGVLNEAIGQRQFTTRLFVGGGITYTALAAVSEFAPQVAGAFATVVLITVMLTQGGPVLTYLIGNTQPKEGKKK